MTIKWRTDVGGKGAARPVSNEFMSYTSSLVLPLNTLFLEGLICTVIKQFILSLLIQDYINNQQDLIISVKQLYP